MKKDHYLIFTIEDQKYSLSIHLIEIVISAIQITFIPKLPEKICGIINLYGKLIPVLNIRKILKFPEKELKSTDHFIIINKDNQRQAIWINDLCGITEETRSEDVEFEKYEDGLQVIDGLLKIRGEIIFILNVDNLLNKEDVVLETI